MNFHYCGNPLHDVITNLVVVLANLPEWLPFWRQCRHRGTDCSGEHRHV